MRKSFARARMVARSRSNKRIENMDGEGAWPVRHLACDFAGNAEQQDRRRDSMQRVLFDRDAPRPAPFPHSPSR